MNKYKIYCEIHGWRYVISSGLPTVCPIDNTDIVDLNSVSIIEEDIQVNDGTPTELDLANYKTLRYNEIDIKTGELISQGYQYQNKVFSLSQNAQINILAIHETRNDPALTYPIKYNTKDDSDYYSVVDATDLHNMYLTALATKKAHLDSGTLIKDQIRAATTKQEVDLIQDNR